MIPHAAIPRLAGPFSGGYRTLVNFEATFGGHNKFWWASSDGSASSETYDEPTEARLYPGSWAPALFLGLDRGVVVKNWLVCGPFGGPGAEKFKADPNGNMPGTKKQMKDAVREFCGAASYPPDSGQVELGARYTGEMIRGNWNDPRTVKWKPASIAELDTRAILGGGGHVWYGATWIKVPAPTELEFQFQSHPQTQLRWTLNVVPVAVPATAYKPLPEGGPLRTQATKKVTLRTGWNQVAFRGSCVGLVLDGAQKKLWDLHLSGAPPQVAALKTKP